MSKFKPFVVAVTMPWIDRVREDSSTEYDNKFDPRATIDDVNRRVETRAEYRENLETDPNVDPDTIDSVVDDAFPLLAVGQYLSNGFDAVCFTASIPNGDGKSVMALTPGQVGGVIDELESFDEAVDISKLDPRECIRRTIARDGDAISFKLSLAKHSRTIIVPVPEWHNFLAYLSTLSDMSTASVEHYRNVTASEEESARKKALAAAARAVPPGK